MKARMTAAELVELHAKGGRKKRVDREGPIHKDILAHLRAVLPAGSIIHHSPNAIGLSGALIGRQIAHNEAMGTAKGFPDLLCILPGPRIWCFEVKAPGNGADADQRALHDRLRDLGCCVAVVKSPAEVDAAIAIWTRLAPGKWVPNDYRRLRDQIIGEGAE